MASKLDLRGQKFGRLTPLYPTDLRCDGYVVWQCRCDCGNLHKTSVSRLKNGQVLSCGCARGESLRQNIAGKRYGRLVAIRPTDQRKSRSVVWECACDCGASHFVRVSLLRRGDIKSCGCLHRETVALSSTVHGLSGTREYRRQQALSRIARKRNADGCHSVDEWLHVVKSHGSSCAGCGIQQDSSDLCRDHIAPLHTGGSDWVANIQPLCGSCNSSKGVQDFWLWMHKKHPDRCTPEYIAEWHAIRKRIDKWFLRRQQQAA